MNIKCEKLIWKCSDGTFFCFLIMETLFEKNVTVLAMEVKT